MILLLYVINTGGGRLCTGSIVVWDPIPLCSLLTFDVCKVKLVIPLGLRTFEVVSTLT